MVWLIVGLACGCGCWRMVESGASYGEGSECERVGALHMGLGRDSSRCSSGRCGGFAPQYCCYCARKAGLPAWGRDV